MYKKQKLLALFLFVGASTFSFSQEKNHKTDVNRDIDVVRVYEQVVREGYGTPYIYKKLASSYYFRNEYEKALVWFQKLFAVEKNTDPNLEYQYSQTLKAVAVENSTESDKNRI